MAICTVSAGTERKEKQRQQSLRREGRKSNDLSMGQKGPLRPFYRSKTYNQRIGCWINRRQEMQKGVNKVILVGNIAEPEVRYTGDGKAIANVSLATSETWKDKNNGEQKEATEWHRLVFFGKLAEIVEKYVKKGSKLYVEGRLQTRSWEKDGVKRYTTEVVCSEMQMLDSRAQPASGAGSTQPSVNPAGGQGAGAPPQSSQPQNFDNFDDDLPF